MGRLGKAIGIVEKKVEREGIGVTIKTAARMSRGRYYGRRFLSKNPDNIAYFDVVFINGCSYDVPHPIRYRVDHQIEQLESRGLACKKIEAEQLTRDDVACAHTFIIFRCPYTPLIGEFIDLAHSLNKGVYFDIDDLVIDTKYTNQIAFLDSMTEEQHTLYDDGVERMGKTLRACGKAITTTERLADELSHYVSEVVLNRNTASEDMLYYSNRAVYERDVLPYLGDGDIPHEKKHYRNWARVQAQNKMPEEVVLGYFSGSITHNEDFEMILPAITEVLDSRQNVKLAIMGELDLPCDLLEYGERITKMAFCEWEKLPEAISRVDINLAPLVGTIFNEAKSENKWVEASLVKVPTVASDLGAFKEVVENGVTGILCGARTDEWVCALLKLIDDCDSRHEIACNAFEYCMEHCTTLSTNGTLAEAIMRNKKPNYMFVLPNLSLSGGSMVALKHCTVLQDAGYDVQIIDHSGEAAPKVELFCDHEIPVLPGKSRKNKDVDLLLFGHVDAAVATLWLTTDLFHSALKVHRYYYLVQNYEAMFYEPPVPHRMQALRTYNFDDVQYLTVSRWCERWLCERFGKQARFIANGIDIERFYPIDRDFGSNATIRILIEGDSASYYKNVDEAFRVVSRLDPDRYEIWYVSYHAKPKEFYRVDRFFHKVPHEDMPAIYRQCHILLKTSILESFSYPPLEMMATGGYVVSVPNEGNAEYLVDEDNCLLYQRGDIDAAVAQIQRIVSDGDLRDRLCIGGLATAFERDWKIIEPTIVEAYA